VGSESRREEIVAHAAVTAIIKRPAAHEGTMS
jgi:hypothetical protein